MLHALIMLGLALSAGLPVIEPTDDLVITSSARIKPGAYAIPDMGEPGVLRVEGEGVVLILDDVLIHGGEEGQTPDTFTGIGLVVKGSAHIIHNGAFRGFKVGVKVEGEGHWVMGTDVSRNFRQHLKSTPKAEDPSDWLWPHENDEGEWAAKYGAGIWVHEATDVRILSVTGRSAQNGLLLDRTDHSVVKGCDFSFNSGWGIALWRSSDNQIEVNRTDWCVRGYSHGVYDRGQDSAGILLFEQCSRNTVGFNSATHCGDGFFLYAGHETTRKTGEGGSNDNIVKSNDFSHAVANGIEATFSTGNRFEDNRMVDCNYGIWAGYSRKSVFARNVIQNCTYAGVAVEHGSENEITGNLIENCPRGISLWWDEDKEFLESIYGEKVRTDSADTSIEGNVIRGGLVGVDLKISSGIEVVGNLIEATEEAVRTAGECPDLVVTPAEEPPELDVTPWRDEAGQQGGRRTIVIHEWGPYDFSSPLLTPVHVEGGHTADFTLLGAARSNRIVETHGDVDFSFKQ
jgi:parallel beta-helix repeat protein